MKFIDLTGQKFFKLTVIGLDVEKNLHSSETYWRCKCDCGNITSVTTHKLRSGRTKSCGCSRGLDLTGKRFGRLVALEVDKEKSAGKTKLYWRCKCDCGNIISTATNQLTSGKTKSCGCLQKEVMVTSHMRPNKIEFDPDRNCYRGYFNNCDGYFLFDLEDLPLVKSRCWYKDRNGYIMTSGSATNNHEHLQLHNLIMSTHFNMTGLEVDHINRNKSDNRKSNMRLCTRSQNLRNRRVQMSNSGHRNIYYDKSRDLYLVDVYIQYNRERGSFKSLDEAISFRDMIYTKYNLNEYYYKPEAERNEENIIYPFTFREPQVIQPFFFINK